MKNILLPLIILSLIACNTNQTDVVNNDAHKLHNRKPAPVTSVSQIEAVGLKDYCNREINYVYKICVDSSSSQELLLKKMYQLQRKLRVPFARPVQSPDFNSYAYILENDVSVFDKLSQTIVGVKELNPLSAFFVGNNLCCQPSIHDYFINLDYFYFSCPFDSSKSASKSIAMMIGSFESKQMADSMLANVKKISKNAYLIKEQERILYVNN